MPVYSRKDEIKEINALLVKIFQLIFDISKRSDEPQQNIYDAFHNAKNYFNSEEYKDSEELSDITPAKKLENKARQLLQENSYSFTNELKLFNNIINKATSQEQRHVDPTSGIRVTFN